MKTLVNKNKLMKITNRQLLEFAKIQDPQDTFDLNSSDN